MALTFTSVQKETICAIATGITESGIGIIRISGPDAIAIAKKLYRNKKGQNNVQQWKANSIHFGYIVDPTQPDCPVIDEVMVSLMRAPHSYTTEDTVEINCHGGVYLMQKILDLALQNGCRMAEPGEFTKRAFLGGRIDLSQAEAVMDLIGSRNEFSRKTALAQLEGSVSGRIKEIREEILYEIAFIESALDDPENYSLDGYPEKLRAKCLQIRGELEKLLDASENGRLLRDGIRTVIVGKPNVGKSSLLNYLSGEERAIVTDVAGTTRDTLEEHVRLGDLILLLTDTAGIHQTTDKVEKIGVDKARKAMDRADLILFLVDLSSPLDDDDAQIGQLIREKVESGTKCIVLMNKSDLPAKISKADVRALMTQSDSAESKETLYYLPVSIREGTGLHTFEELLAKMFHAGEISVANDVFLSSVREKQEVLQAKASIDLVLQSIDNGMSEDFFSIDLMNAYRELGKILGESVEDDLVEEIFSKFCLGK